MDEQTQVRGDFGYSTRRAVRDPQLRWVDGQGSHSFLLTRSVLLGSAEQCDVRVYDSEVSRIHASLDLVDGEVWVRDLNARNGVWVNGVRVREAVVPDGGVLHVGATDLRLYHDQNEAQVELWPFDRFGPLWGRTDVMRLLFVRLSRIAAMDSTALVLGETGTGKELVARAIHKASRRADRPFVVVDCGALSESLLEAELFGHAKGAFTGAQSARAGAIEAAEGGTVFLDEIGEMPLSMQPKLLRALEGHTVRRVGEAHYRDVDVRFIAATHRDLGAMVNDGSFREDLFFRLSVLPVTVPPLRQRLDDIPLLVEKLLPQGTTDVVGPELLRELSSRQWPGNVRELRNFVERALALGAREALRMARPAPTPPPSTPPPARTTPAPDAPSGPDAARDGFPRVSIDENFKSLRDRCLDHLEREYLRAMIDRHQRDTSAIAQASGLDRSYIYRLIRKHEL